jgi:uncharacterized membrane protein
MNTVKVMSIISIVIFSLCLLAILAFIPLGTVITGYSAEDIYNAEATMGFGILSVLWGLPYAITCLVQSKKSIEDNQNQQKLI